MNGDCGITIKNAGNQDNGKWTCILRLFDLEEDVKMSLYVTVDEPLTKKSKGIKKKNFLFFCLIFRNSYRRSGVSNVPWNWFRFIITV